MAHSKFDAALVRVDTAWSWFESVLAQIAAVFIFGLMVLGVVQIVSRQIFDKPIVAYIDLVELLMTTFALLAISYAEKVGAHVRMDLVVGKLSGRLRWLFELFAVLVALFLVLVLIRYSWGHMMRAYVNGDTTIDAQLPWWPSKLLIPFALSVLAVRLTISTVELGRLVRNPLAPVLTLPNALDVQQQADREALDAGASTREATDGAG